MVAHSGKKFVHRSTGSRPNRVAVAAFLGLVFGLVFVQPRGQAQTQPPDALPYAGGYLVTGNYVVGGVDLTDQANPADPVTGLSTGIIRMHGVPTDAIIVAAYLYWETITSDLTQANGVTFRGNPINLDDPVAVKRTSMPLTGNAATCWSSGTPLTMSHFKADVLQFLPIRKDSTGKPTPIRLVNDSDLGDELHTVQLPTRSGNQVPESAGASLVVIYVDPNPSEPLRKIVFYDGIYIQPSLTTPMTQSLRGFYKSALPKSAKVTSIGANGQPNNNERIFFNGTQKSPSDPLFGGSASQRGWSQHETGATPIQGVTRDATYNVSNQMTPGSGSTGHNYGETATFAVDHTPGGAYDCLTWGAVVFSTAVADTDPASDPFNSGAPSGDGIPDGLEDATSGLTDPDGVVLPNLNAMGASSGHRDLFVEFGAMWAAGGTSWGTTGAPYDSAKNITTVTDSTGHQHMPTPADLKMIGDRYAAHGITPHFDVGSIADYHKIGEAYDGTDDPTDPNFGKIQHVDWVDDYTSTVADGYLVPSNLARGGEIIKERACDPASPVCFFPDFPGTVPWRFGVQSYKDYPVGDDGEELTASQLNDPEDPNYVDWNAGDRRRRFDRNRRGLFHYLLIAHLGAKRRSPFPCLLNGQPVPYSSNSTVCPATATNNPDYFVPSGRSGIADLAGDTALVTPGRFDEFVGRPFQRAATIFHELGHNFNLWHGGLPAIWGSPTTATYFEPNCKPFPTSMSYIYQLHGLFDNDDNIYLDYSNVTHADLDEASRPYDQELSPATIYRPAWYAPANSTLATNLGVPAASRFCSGLPFNPNALPGLPAPMARVYAEASTGLLGTIDWDGDGVVNNDQALQNQDVNFDGTLTTLPRKLSGFNEWATLRLNQMSAGVTLRFYRVGQGDEFVPGQGSGFLPNEGDELVPSGGDEFIPGSGDEFIPGSGDEFIPGSGDEFIPGSGDELVPSGGDEFIPGSGLPELDEVAARGLGRTVPYRVKTCNIGEQNCQSPPNPDPQFLIHRVHAAWDPPVVDPVSQYLVSRKRVDTNGTNYPWVDRPPTPSSTPAYDNTEHLPNGVQFTFRVRARFFDQALSGYSRLITTATITARNDAPVATNDSYTTERNRTLRISTRAAGVLGNDTDEDTPAALLKARVVTGSGPSSGTLTLNPEDGTFTYTPQNGFTGTVTFKYVAHNGTWSEDPTVSISPDSNEATVTITVTAK